MSSHNVRIPNALRRPVLAALLAAVCLTAAAGQTPQPSPANALTPRFELKSSGLRLERRTRPGAFFDVLGRKSAVFGYEHRQAEAWAYPLQILDGFELSFRVEGYPLEFKGSDTAALIEVRPEATTITYSHAAFTVRQIIYAPLDEAGVVMLLDVDSALPVAVTARFRPRLKLMWPAASATPSLSWDEKQRAYFIYEETGRYAGMVGSPAARDVSVMPYQEEPRDVPAEFRMEVPASELKSNFIPIVIAGSVKGREEARATYARLLGSARALYEQNVEHYRRLRDETTSVETPDERVNEAFAWAKVGIDKAFVENPLLGLGLVAGFRTAGESERPGFAWFFGRDALWTALALDAYGDFEGARGALDFLKKYQRADGKIPHEISQSASLVPWFTDYPYAWASADATPLYIIAHADYFRASGDVKYLRANWDSIVRAYRFTKATDTDGNGLVENTNFGHGWVEGGSLYPPHEEIYMQGLWVEALRGVEEMAAALDEEGLAAETGEAAERVSEAIEKTYWLDDRGLYAFATNRPRTEPREADKGPNQERRQQRMNEQDKSALYDEDTVLPAVPLWFGVLEEERAQREIDRLGSGHIATDWGARIISDESRLYDPLSYHSGSVWPLFTGWASMGAYAYGRPHVGFQALMSNVLLREQGALGYTTELLSGDYNAPFGRSSHHQVWSEAMTVTPLLRGLLGIEVKDHGSTVRVAPQLPADWNNVTVRRVRAGESQFDFILDRSDGVMRIMIFYPEKQEARPPVKIELAPAFPLDARVKSVEVGDKPLAFRIERVGDTQSAVFEVDPQQAGLPFMERRMLTVVVKYEEGVDVFVRREAPRPGDTNTGLRVLRSRVEKDWLRLLVEGLPGRVYTLNVRGPRPNGVSGLYEGVSATSGPGGERSIGIEFKGEPGRYVRREIAVPLGPPAPRRAPKPNPLDW
ncbi:MAG: amylo-alpha-1,6-glucosidase [Acidobacteria bacterium]|nr:amylo-alpha-1,6-glucosidase [Acidobacteriota bacterium]